MVPDRFGEKAEKNGDDGSMTTQAQNVKFRRQMAKLEASRRTPDKVKMPPREQIRIKRRCNMCGRARAVYRKFGICRICFRNMASNGLIPGVRKASW
jgi:ribosomal protein S14